MRAKVSAFLIYALAWPVWAAPVVLDNQFELPRGFHIYRAAGPELTGGSYDITFDGEGRLLVGDGTAVRRLKDADGDGVFDGFDVIATGLGPRGPQGLLVNGDHLYAVGGDGVQVFEGYRSGRALQHKGRIGKKFGTGGDHDAHTIFRGHDGFLYFMAGNGAGISRRTHITEATSPALTEREASVFRISPDGAKWECIGSGGRNPPNLGMNYLGDLFSFDSDMEWHVGLPWYRPVRLNHWVVGGDQGWQEVGAYPPYYIDCLPGILDVGRGSPTWGVFYEHTQFPAKYRNAYLCCDYRWKRESNDQYATTGRLVAFFLKRKGASWTAEMETLARPKSGARDQNGKPINFALVDVDVAPDGSIFVSDHNQGLWRIYFSLGAPASPPAHSAPFASGDASASRLGELLSLPQPGAEWSRVREEQLRKQGGPELESQIRALAANRRKPLDQRLRAIRLLLPQFAELPTEFVELLARDGLPEVRGQAAYIFGIQGRPECAEALCKLLDDSDAFVRRRAAEALERINSPAATDALIEHLADSSRTVRYTAMIALAHQPTGLFFDKAMAKHHPQICMRALLAASLRGDLPADAEINRAISLLLDQSREDELDFLRVLGLFRKVIAKDAALQERLAHYLGWGFSEPFGWRSSRAGSSVVSPHQRNIRWEQIRLIGEYQVTVFGGFSKLLLALGAESDEVTQFHIAQALSQFKSGWSPDEEKRLIDWLLTTQQGWFAEFASKGVEFPEFWMTVLSDFAAHHRSAILERMSRIDLASLLGTVILRLVAQESNAPERLTRLYEQNSASAVRVKILNAMAAAPRDQTLAFCRSECNRASDPQIKSAALKTLAIQSSDSTDAPRFFEGITNRQIEIVRACATALLRIKPALREDEAQLLIGRLGESSQLCRTLDPLLLALTRENAPALDSRLTDAQRATRVSLWRGWYAKNFGKDLEPKQRVNEKTDDEILTFLLSKQSKGGDRIRGGQVYELLQCHTCHGGGINPGREGGLFGPDLAGVTRRLSPREFAEALVYPSKQVPDRYKAYEVTLKNGTVLAGFITEQNDSSVTLAARDQVHRLSRPDIESLRLQSTSLMPDHLLNPLSWEQIKDLLAFLEEGPVAANPRH